MQFNIDQFSFWVGFAAGGVTLWMLRLLGPTFRDLWKALMSRASAVQTGISGSIEQRYRQDIVRIAQDNHIASPLFSLDEVSLPVRFLAPPPMVIPEDALPPDDTFSLTIPYMPDWPEMAATYNTPTLSFEQALEGQVDLVIIGKPGIGKSFALNQLATRLARQDPKLGNLSESFPVLVHVGDLGLPAKKGELLDIIYEAFNEKVSVIVEAQLSDFLVKIFRSGIVILMVDGVDELPREEQNSYLEYLLEIKKKYPKTRLILTGSTEQIPHIDGLDLFTLPMAAWDMKRRSEFVFKWGELWEKFILKEGWARKLPKPINAIFIDGWLRKDPTNSNPLYLTLKLWSTYAGDIMGPSVAESLDAYIQRMSGHVTNSRNAMEQFAAQAVLSITPMVERKQAGKFVAEFEDPEAPSDFEHELQEETNNLLGEEFDGDDIALIDEDLMELDDFDIPDLIETPKKQEKKVSARSVRRMLPEMVNNYLLVYRSNARIGFAHPVIGGYLAGCGLAKMGGEHELLTQPNWVGKRLSLQYLAAKKDVSGLISQILGNAKNEPLGSSLLNVGEWLSIASKNPVWKGAVLQALASALKEAHLSLGYKARVLTALAISGDAGIPALFQQLLTSPQHEVQLLGALGSGIVQDTKAATQLNELLYSPVPNVRRAACLALASFNTTESIEMVAGALLQGEDDARRAAAEALSQNVEEGHPILKEGAEMEDLSVRRAVTFGLGWIEEPWARGLLEKLQLEDEQWMVRTSAGQVIDALDKPSPFTPKHLDDLTNTPWLITFASERGMGLAPGSASWDMLKLALSEGNEDQRLAAMEHYRRHPQEAKAVMPVLVNFLNGNDGEMREAAYYTLWQVGSSGVPL